jgi:hypothetical protein
MALTPMTDPKPPLTVTELARMGGNARAASLTPEQRSESARAANRARWDSMTEAERDAYRESCRVRALESWRKRKEPR